MPSLLDNLRLLESAQGYADLGLFIQSNRELEKMSPETRHWPEVLAIKLAIFNNLMIWEMADIVATQLARSAKGNPRWLALAQSARRDIHIARRLEKTLIATAASSTRPTFQSASSPAP